MYQCSFFRGTLATAGLRRISLLLLMTTLLFTAWPILAASGGPTQQLSKSITAIIGLLKDKTLDKADRRQKIAELIYQRFDFRAMSQRALATNWRRASGAERQRFVDRFSKLILESYIGRIEAYTDERINYVGERIKGRRALVSTVIVSNVDIPIRYKLHLNKDGKWRVYDVVVEEVSLIRTFRSSYRDIVKREGVQGLLVRMDEKIAMLEKTRP